MPKGNFLKNIIYLENEAVSGKSKFIAVAAPPLGHWANDLPLKNDLKKCLKK